MAIGTYNYTYGAGQAANRQIHFFRSGTANTIQAQVYVLNANGTVGIQTSNVEGNNIEVEGQNAILGAALAPNQLLSNLSTQEQDGIMHSLSERKMMIISGHGVPGGLEVVQKLMISALP